MAAGAREPAPEPRGSTVLGAFVVGVMLGMVLLWLYASNRNWWTLHQTTCAQARAACNKATVECQAAAAATKARE